MYPKRGMRFYSLAILAVLLLFGAFSNSRGADIQWVGYQGCAVGAQVGSFFHGDNWLNYVVPDSEDVAIFDPTFDPQDNGMPYYIHFGNFCVDQFPCPNPIEVPGGDAVIQRLEVHSGSWTFDFASGTWGGGCQVQLPLLGSLEVADHMHVGWGEPAEAHLTIRNGAVIAGNVVVGGGGGNAPTGSLILDGQSARLTSQGAFDVGRGQVIVQSGAQLQSHYSRVGDGYAGGETRYLFASGAGTTVTLSDHLAIGNGGSGRVVVSDGATLGCNGFKMGDYGGQNTSCLITGNASNFTMGSNGIATLWSAATFEIADHAHVLAPNAFNVEHGALSVTASGQLEAGQMDVGHAGNSSVLISDDGVLHLTNSLSIGAEMNGSLAISNGGQVLAASMKAPRCCGSVGTLAVENQGSVLQVIGDLELGSEGQADASITDGALLQAGRFLVGPSGLVHGNGVLEAEVNNDGLICPGDSVGTLAIQGGYTQETSGSLIVQIAGSQAGQFDVLHVTGQASLGGTLDVRFIDGFNPTPGSQYDVLLADSIAGVFDEIVPTGGAITAEYLPGLVRVTVNASPKDWSGLGDGENWEDPDNWSPPGVPGPDDDVRLTKNGTHEVTLSSPATVYRLTVGSATSATTLHVVSDTLKTRYGGENRGTGGVISLEEGGTLHLAVGASFLNQPGATVWLRSGSIAGDGSFLNTGFVDVTSELPGTSRISVLFTNAAGLPAPTVEVSDGILVIDKAFSNLSLFRCLEGADVRLDPGDGPLRTDIVTNSGYVLVDSGATLTITGPNTVFRNIDPGDVELRGGHVLGTGSFDNYGDVQKTNPPSRSATTSRIAVFFDNLVDDPGDGAVHVDEGALAIEGEFENAGSLSVKTGAEAMLDPGEGPLRADLFRNRGLVTIEDGAALRINGTSTRFANLPEGTIRLLGGDLMGDGLLANGGLVLKTDPEGFSRSISALGCRFENAYQDPGDGALTVGGGTVVVEDSFSNEGTVHVEGDGELTVQNSAPLRAGDGGAHFANQGNVRVEPGASFRVLATATNGRLGAFDIGGTATVGDGAEWLNWGRTVIAEDGALRVSSGRETPGLFVNRGTTELHGGGSVENEGTFENRENGILGGVGAFDNTSGSFLSDGIIRPGLSIGDLAFLGDLTLTSMSEIDIEIGGTLLGQYDRLLVTGQVSFGGALAVALANGFVPAINDEFGVIIGTGGVKGGRSLSCTSGLNVPGGLYLQPVEEGQTLTLVTTTDPGTNQVPVATDNEDSTGVNTSVTMELLLNDTDPDGDPLRILALSTAGLAGFASIDPEDSTVTYTPPLDFSGVDEFRYVVGDCNGGGDSATVTVRVATPPRAWHVPGDAPTIREGLDLSAVGDTVIVACGVYHEHDIAMKSGITLRSESGLPTCVTIDADAQGRALLCDGVGSGTRIVGFRFVNGLAPDGGAVLCTGVSAPTFETCAFTGNRSGGKGGALSSGAMSSLILRNCTVAGNHAARGGGIDLGGSAILEQSIVWKDCAVGEGMEIYLDASASLHVSFSDVDTSGVDGPGILDWGTGSLSANPRFCGALDCADAPSAGGNYKLDMRSSPVFIPPGAWFGGLGVGCWGHLTVQEGVDLRAYLVAVGVDGGDAAPQPATFFFASPNPSREGVTVTYAKQTAGAGALRIYDVAGRLVRTYNLETASGRVRWDGADAGGRRVAPGVYFLRLMMGAETETKRVLLVR